MSIFPQIVGHDTYHGAGHWAVHGAVHENGHRAGKGLVMGLGIYLATRLGNGHVAVQVAKYRGEYWTGHEAGH